jgi:hypothetical protein
MLRSVGKGGGCLVVMGVGLEGEGVLVKLVGLIWVFMEILVFALSSLFVFFPISIILLIPSIHLSMISD